MGPFREREDLFSLKQGSGGGEDLVEVSPIQDEDTALPGFLLAKMHNKFQLPVTPRIVFLSIGLRR